MKKIKTLFKKDINDLSKVTKEFDKDNEWVLTSGLAYRKLDGTACMIKDGEIYKRYDAKINSKTKTYKRPIPKDAISCQEPDMQSGHHPHWVKCNENNPSDKYHIEAFKLLTNKSDGTYELVGEKINGNPENLVRGHNLIRHIDISLYLLSFNTSQANDYNYVKKYLKPLNIEGIVFHDKKSGRMCKIRKKDFGLKREAK